MNKRFLALMLALCLCAMMGSCTVRKEAPEPEIFVTVEYGPSWRVVYHRQTRVVYVVSRSNNNYGNFTMLVNADGSPLIWEANYERAK